MEEKIYFKNSKGDKLCGLLDDVGKERIAILCHGHSSGKNNKTFQLITPRLLENHISVFRFDFYGNKESEGKFENSDLTETIDDTLQAIKLVKDKGFQKITLVGSSFGGLSSIVTAAKSPDLATLVLKSPVSDYGEVHLGEYGKAGMEQWKQTGKASYPPDGDGKLFLNYSFVEDYKKYDVYSLAGNIKIPTFIVHGGEDITVPLSQSQKLVKIIPNAKLEIVEGADHWYHGQNKFQQMVDILSEFIINEQG